MEKTKTKIIGIYGPAGSGKDFLCDCIRHFYNKISDSSSPKEIDWIKIYYEFAENHFTPVLRENIFSFSQRIAFADPLKNTLSCLTNVPLGWFYNTKKKDNTLINLETLETKDINEIDQSKVVNDELWYSFIEGMNIEDRNYIQNLVNTKDIWMTLRDLMTYFGTYLVRHYISNDFWITRTFNDMKNPESEDNLKIITDIRFKNEYDAIKSIGGKLIEVTSDFNEKNVGGEAESHYEEFDFDYLFMNTKDSLLFLQRFRKLFELLFPEFFN